MKTRMLLSLEQAMRRWLDENCEEDDWPDTYVTHDITERMATAAAGIFDAMSEGQIFAEREGYVVPATTQEG